MSPSAYAGCARSRVARPVDGRSRIPPRAKAVPAPPAVASVPRRKAAGRKQDRAPSTFQSRGELLCRRLPPPQAARVRRGITLPNPVAIPVVQDDGRAGASIAFRARRDCGRRNVSPRKLSRREGRSRAPCRRDGVGARIAAPGHGEPSTTERAFRPPQAIRRVTESGN